MKMLKVKQLANLLLLWGFLLSGAVWGRESEGDALRVLPLELDGGSTEDMMSRYLLGQVDALRERWIEEYEKRETPEAITDYQQRLKKKFVEALGGFPERKPLNSQITGVIKRKGYRVEKVIFESQPKHFVTALMFVPESQEYRPPYPGVLIPCGHSREGKANELYQTQGAALALRGMAALIFDPIDQGERAQYLDANHEAPIWGTRAHTMVGVASILLGRNTARYEIWDGMRAIDYLQSHPSVDAERIGCTGNSGGGTQTSYLMALDERITAAAPSCYLTHFHELMHTIGCQDAEQNIFGQLAFGMDHADYVMMRAPKPTLICAATQDFFSIKGTWETYRHAKRLYTRMGFAERVGLVENDDKHGYKPLLREGAARWMSRWLLGKDEAFVEPEIELLSEEDCRCTPQGQVMLLEGARSVYDLNEDYENELAKQREEMWRVGAGGKMLEKVLSLAGIRRLEALGTVTTKKVDEIQREGYKIEKIIIQPESLIYLPALVFVPQKQQQDEVVLYVHEEGKAVDAEAGGPIEEWVQDGYVVLAVDLRGSGETKQNNQTYGRPYFGEDAQDVYAAYVMGRSYVGMRAEDVLVCARYAAKQWGGEQEQGVRLVAVGNVGVPALHAAAVEPGLFASVEIKGMLISWADIIQRRFHQNQLVNAVHGALTVYDLGDLVRSLGDKITVEQSVDAQAKPN